MTGPPTNSLPSTVAATSYDPLFEKTGSTYTYHVYANGRMVAKIAVSGVPTETYYYIADALESTRQVWKHGATSPAFSVATYKPFGTPVTPSGSEKFEYAGEMLVGAAGTAPGLYYIFARWMDPELGRFISLDPELGKLSMPQSMNRYVYCVNNPLRFTDPTGLGFWSSLSKWWDKHGATVIQVVIIVAAVAATVATAGIASPLLAAAAGAAIGASSSFLSTYAATGDLGASLKSAGIGGIPGAAGGAIGAKLAQAGMGVGLASKSAARTGLGLGKMTSGWSKADEAAFGLRTMFKHDFIRLSGEPNLGRLAGGSSYWASRGFAVSDEAAEAFGQMMRSSESMYQTAFGQSWLAAGPEWRLAWRLVGAAAAERAGHIVFEQIGEWMSTRSRSLPSFG
ncbi:MAG: RHS repeat-associated core domain-containing protein [Thermoplasmata archaeon]